MTLAIINFAKGNNKEALIELGFILIYERNRRSEELYKIDDENENTTFNDNEIKINTEDKLQTLSLSHSHSFNTFLQDNFFPKIFCDDDSVYLAAVNNFAILSLHIGNARGATTLLESYIKLDPCYFMDPTLCQNLKFMYDLITDKARKEKKLALWKEIANRFCLHDISLLF